MLVFAFAVLKLFFSVLKLLFSCSKLRRAVLKAKNRALLPCPERCNRAIYEQSVNIEKIVLHFRVFCVYISENIF